MQSVAIIDYGRGNIHSVAKAVAYLRAEPELVSSPRDLASFGCAILPGVGAFADAIAALRSTRLAGAVREFAASGKPLLGICLGMQLLLQTGAEGGLEPGLGLVRGQVRLLAAPGLKVPHVGWNAVSAPGPGVLPPPLLTGIPDSYFYFVHSYAAFPEDPADWAASTTYGERFASVIGRGTVWGTQFHPEKSGSAGLHLLRNFLSLGEGRH